MKKYLYFGGTVVLHIAAVISAVIFDFVHSFWPLLVILFLPLCIGIALKVYKKDEDLIWGILMGFIASIVILVILFFFYLSKVKMC